MLHTNKKPVQFKIYTGVDISVMSESTYQALQLQPSNAILFRLSPGGRLNCKGQFTANIVLNGKTYSEDLYIIEGPCVNNLLGRQAAHRMGLVQRINETTGSVYRDVWPQ